MLFQEYLPEIKNLDAFTVYINFIQENRVAHKTDEYYYETHHIVPRCYLPEDLHTEKENLAILRGKNHLKAHILLHEALQDAPSAYAVWQMLHRRDEQGSIEDVSIEQYEYFKQIHQQNAAKNMSQTMRGRPSSNKGRKLTEIHRKHISEAQKGKKLSAEHIEHLSESHTGYQMPQAQKDKISASNKNKVKDSIWRKNLSDSNKGKSHGIKGGVHVYRILDETIERTIIPESALNTYIDQGWIKGRYGVNTRFSSGSKGVNKGRLWITDGYQNKVIHKDKLEEYITNGWHKGKTFHKNR